MTVEWEVIPELKQTLQDNWETAQFKEPTPIQRKAIPLILAGKDVIGQAPTGTGKTLAYVLPLLEKIDADKKNAQAIILAPSHELVMQIYEVIQTWSKGTGITAVSLIGGANVKRQLERLKKKPQIIVASPGRLSEIIKMKKLKMHEVKTIVMDEVDQLLVQEHTATIKDIVKTTMNDRQILFFSATSLDDPSYSAEAFGMEPELVDVEHEGEQGKVAHVYFVCEQREKAKLFERVVKGIPMKGLAFAKDIGSMDVTAKKLAYEGVPLVVLHGDLNKGERGNALKQLRSGEASLLFATDVAARGLDIEELTHVLHVDFPGNKAQYLHRSGRTGRMGADGTVISFVTPREERTLKQYGRELGVEVAKKVFYKGQIMDKPKQGNN